jgi:hypothetical protein
MKNLAYVFAVVVSAFGQMEPLAPGVTYRRIAKEAGPFVFHVLEVDPRLPAINLLPVHALDRAAGKETVSSMAKRYGAVAAVNGGYFHVMGPYAGASAGVYQWSGQVLAGGSGRSALVFCREDSFRERMEIGVVNFRGVVNGRALSGMNGPRSADEMMLYTPMMGSSTKTEAGGVEVALGPDGVVRSVEEDKGNMAIPADGQVISAAGASAQWLREQAKPGTKLRVDARLEPAASGCDAEDILGAGPSLIREGRVEVRAEGFAHQDRRHPRTVFAVTQKGTFLFVTLDGRQAASVGMTLRELAEELLGWGAVEAINLDGGGSSTMVARGQIRNWVSDPRERPVSDAVLIFSISTVEEWREVFEELAKGQMEAEVARRVRQLMAASPARMREALEVIRGEQGRGVSRAAARVLMEPLGEWTK